jgi:hypothetical protein
MRRAEAVSPQSVLHSSTTKKTQQDKNTNPSKRFMLHYYPITQTTTTLMIINKVTIVCYLFEHFLPSSSVRTHNAKENWDGSSLAPPRLSLLIVAIKKGTHAKET